MKKPYFPKPVRGLAYPGYVKISKAQALKLLASGQSVNGFLVGNNVNPFHFFDGWRLACEVFCSNAKDFEGGWNSFHVYLDPELGRGAALYIREPYKLRAHTLWTLAAMKAD